MNRGEEFLQAILADPNNDHLRLVYADWLEENSDPRGEFIRLQFALARLPPGEGLELRARELELIREHKEEWFGTLRQHIGYWEAHRGFLDEVSTQAVNFLQHADELFARHPVQHVTLRGLTPHIRGLAGCPHLQHVSSLNLSANGLTAGHLRTLVASPYLQRLSELDLGHNQAHNAGVQALAGCPGLRRLTRLVLVDNRIGQTGARALLSSPYLNSLEELDLRNNPIPAQAVEALTRRFRHRLAISR
jgi:uncharacterized protein (TIGR02996 family)